MKISLTQGYFETWIENFNFDTTIFRFSLWMITLFRCFLFHKYQYSLCEQHLPILMQTRIKKKSSILQKYQTEVPRKKLHLPLYLCEPYHTFKLQDPDWRQYLQILPLYFSSWKIWLDNLESNWIGIDVRWNHALCRNSMWNKLSCIACGLIYKAQFIWGALYSYHPSSKVKFSL